MNDDKQYFVTRFRESTGDEKGEPFVTLTDNAPQWLKEAVRDAHQGTMPNDWFFSICADAWSRICEEEKQADWIHDFADSEVDIYTKDVY